MLDRSRARRSRRTSRRAARSRRRRSRPSARSRCAARRGAPTYIVHLSSARALAACAAARAEGLPVFVETRPLYLHLTSERYRERDGALYVAQPPLRERADQEALWRGLADGTIDTIASDHAPWTRELKLDPKLDVTHCRPGVAELDTMLPLLYTEGVATGRLSLERFVALTVDQRRPPVRHVPAQGDDRGRLRRRPRRSGRRASGARARRRPVFARRATASTRGASCAPGRRPPSAAARWCSRTARSLGQPGSGQAIGRGRDRAAARAPEPSPERAATGAYGTRRTALARVGIWWSRTGTVLAPRCDGQQRRKRHQPNSPAARPAAGGAARRRADRDRRAAPRLDSLRTPRIVPMEQLTLDIGRRPNPTPLPDGAPRRVGAGDPGPDGLQRARPHPARVERRPTCSSSRIWAAPTAPTSTAGGSSGPTPLRDGAVLFLGSQVLVFRVVTPAELEALQEDAATPFAPLPTLLARAGGDQRQAAAARAHQLRDPARRRDRRRQGGVRERHPRRTAAAPASWSRSTARRSRASWSRASCSATRRARTRPRRDARSAWSSWPTAARCSSTRSATCRSSCSRSCCASCRIGASRRSARRASSRPTCASSPPPAASALEKGAARPGGGAGPPGRAADRAAAAARAHRGRRPPGRAFPARARRRPRVRARGLPRAAACTPGRSTCASCRR